VNNRATESIFTIASPADATDLQRRARAFMIRGIDSIEIAHPSLTDLERARWHRRLTFLVNVCGCQVGAVAAIAAILICIFDPPFALQMPMALLADIGFVVTASIAGKCAAVAVARIALQLELQRLMGVLATGAVRVEEG